MKTIKLLFILSIFFSAISCKEEQKSVEIPMQPGISTFYFIRHAEKDRSDPENKNPELNQEGLGRAIKWAEVLDPVAIDAIYSTDFKRTTMTAAPTEIKKNLTLQLYNLSTLDIEAFKNDNLGKNVLVVGHSNTIPEFVNQILGAQKYSAMDDYDNGSLFIVRIMDGIPTDIRLKID
ncbi:histidine phosphatase family protein [Arenibacter sp. 6A1]|uniref:SixA phosphatase family protein n=1 Tax=Arenibacter sp. 6A1 TaxID=2720391 RepID=UPI001448738D|nr:phosphoglycerate mutase family protein [Arenibacter sp. 6A1]NKI25927.1 histidine phosphatase family protein [Arenibacter sp. 6A1]